MPPGGLVGEIEAAVVEAGQGEGRFAAEPVALPGLGEAPQRAAQEAVLAGLDPGDDAAVGGVPQGDGAVGLVLGAEVEPGDGLGGGKLRQPHALAPADGHGEHGEAEERTRADQQQRRHRPGRTPWDRSAHPAPPPFIRLPPGAEPAAWAA